MHFAFSLSRFAYNPHINTFSNLLLFPKIKEASAAAFLLLNVMQLRKGGAYCLNNLLGGRVCVKWWQFWWHMPGYWGWWAGLSYNAKIFSCTRVIITSKNGNQINRYYYLLISLLDGTRNKNYVTSLLDHMLACFASFLVSNK